jgi:hypothetical protein
MSFAIISIILNTVEFKIFTVNKIGLVVLALTLLSSSVAAIVLPQSVNAQLMQQNIQQTVYQLRQIFIGWEQQLAQSSPQERQDLISRWQQGTFNRLVQEDPQTRFSEIRLLEQSMSPQLAQLILYPVLSQLNQSNGISNNSGNVPSQPTSSPTGRSAPEQQAYNLGYQDGYHSGTTAKPSICMILGPTMPSLDSNCALEQQFPQAYSAGFQAGITAAGNAIHEGKVPPPPIGQTGGSSSKFNPYGTFDYCLANPDTEANCEAQRRSNR